MTKRLELSTATNDPQLVVFHPELGGKLRVQIELERGEVTAQLKTDDFVETVK